MRNPMLEDSISRSCVRGAVIASVMAEVLRRMRIMIREINPTEATIIVWNMCLEAGTATVRKTASPESVLSAGMSENPILFWIEEGGVGVV